MKEIVRLQERNKVLISRLRDCHDLLNDCGFFYVNGRWIDSDNVCHTQWIDDDNAEGEE
jgi:hypothetical protein